MMATFKKVFDSMLALIISMGEQRAKNEINRINNRYF